MFFSKAYTLKSAAELFLLLLDGDNLDNMEGVSLQAVTLSDGSTAYIQHNSKGILRI